VRRAFVFFLLLTQHLTTWSGAEKQLHDQRREDARDLMKWIQEKNDDIEPGRKVRVLLSFPYRCALNVLFISCRS